MILAPRTLREIETAMDAASDSEFLIDDLVHAGMTTILGDAWVGKTFLALMLADSLTTGKPIFGRKLNGPPRQLYWLSTDPRGERSITKRARGMDLDLDRIYAQSFYTPADPFEWRTIVDELLDLPIGVVVIDNTTDLSEDANAPRETKLVTDGLRRMVDAGIAVVNVHHSGGQSKRKPELGSRLWGKATRLRLTLTGDPFTSPGPRKLTSMPNDGPAHEWSLHFDPDRADVLREITETKRAQDRRQGRGLDQQRLAKMQERDDWTTQSEIALALGVDPSTVTRVLRKTKHQLRDGNVVPLDEAA